MKSKRLKKILKGDKYSFNNYPKYTKQLLKKTLSTLTSIEKKDLYLYMLLNDIEGEKFEELQRFIDSNLQVN